MPPQGGSQVLPVFLQRLLALPFLLLDSQRLLVGLLRRPACEDLCRFFWRIFGTTVLPTCSRLLRTYAPRRYLGPSSDKRDSLVSTARHTGNSTVRYLLYVSSRFVFSCVYILGMLTSSGEVPWSLCQDVDCCRAEP